MKSHSIIPKKEYGWLTAIRRVHDNKYRAYSNGRSPRPPPSPQDLLPLSGVADTDAFPPTEENS